jgi:cyclopropane fatty-acyl-phospholipid synthase-like methyltransferase
MVAYAPMSAERPVLPPGTILQQRYVRERLQRQRPGRFVEVGTGAGELSALLLDAGWTGVGYEPGPAADRARARNRDAIAEGRYALRAADWLSAAADEPADLVVSSMVIEHLPDADEARYFDRARATLTPAGRAMLLVPASPRHWGIEDDIAGHQRRYERAALAQRLSELGWRLDHIAGLTFPLSNLLLPISNRLVARAERDRLAMSEYDRTLQSGDRDVAGKTSFPAIARVLLNERTLYPLHVLQRAFRNSDRALVLYAEAVPVTPADAAPGSP